MNVDPGEPYPTDMATRQGYVEGLVEFEPGVRHVDVLRPLVLR